MIEADLDTALHPPLFRMKIKDVFVESWENMERFGIFDTMTLLNRSIGMGGNKAGVRAIFEKCHLCSSPKGVLIFDSYEVKPGSQGNRSEILEKKIKYKYNNEYSDEFPWIHLSSNVAEKLLNDTGWSLHKVTRVEDKYCIVASKS